MSEGNKAVVRAVEEAWDRQDLDSLDQHFAPEFDNSGSAVPGLPGGLEGAKMAHHASMQSFPDRKVHIEEMLADGDQVMVRARITGTNQGGFPMMNVPPNGNAIDIAFVGIYTLRDGKVVSHWGLNDAATLMQQLTAGAAPA
jgi:predicted ester cyclase